MNALVPNLLILGASARAAAFSALRAGLRPWCADLFADTDLTARCPVVRIPVADYPRRFLDCLTTAPRAPWIYTGGLENRPTLIERMARVAPLWGNGLQALQRVRDPYFVTRLLNEHGLPMAPVRRLDGPKPRTGRWLLKPRAGAGGVGIHPWQPGTPVPSRPSAFYLQEFIEGEACSAVFVAAPADVTLVGVTRQLVGEPWLNAGAFQYCGSVSICPPTSLVTQLQRLGQVLAEGCNLRGLFGVDFILRDHFPVLIEINPRYTASVEVVENACGIAALGLHRRAFEPTAPAAPTFPMTGESMGKAILFARESFSFPSHGPWRDSLATIGTLSAFADIPAAGEVIDAGGPVCTLFARGKDSAECLTALRHAADQLVPLLR